MSPKPSSVGVEGLGFLVEDCLGLQGSGVQGLGFQGSGFGV